MQDAHLGELIVAYQQTVLQANSEVEDGVARFLQSQDRARDLAASVDAANKAYIIGASQYRGGTIDFTRLVLVEQNLVVQQDSYAQAQGEIAQGLVDTYRALGGGWEIRCERLPAIEPIPMPPTQPTPSDQHPMEPIPMPGPSEMNTPAASPQTILPGQPPKTPPQPLPPTQ
jgi:hypothetical protein